MSLELNHTVAEILARSPAKGPPVVIAPEILSAAQLEVKDFLAGATSDADMETIETAHAAARKQLTGAAVAGGEPVPPLALTQAMLDLAALSPPVAVPHDVVEAAKSEQALALANVVPATPLQREAIARAYAKVEALAATDKPAPGPLTPKPAAGALPPVTAPVLAPAVAAARAANLTILPAWETAVTLEASLIASGASPTAEQAKTLSDALAAVKAALPK